MNLTMVDQLPPPLSWPSSLTRKRTFSGATKLSAVKSNQQVAHTGRQSQAIRRVVRLAVGGDLLDVNRRRKLVEGKMMRIDDADAADHARTTACHPRILQQPSYSP